MQVPFVRGLARKAAELAETLDHSAVIGNVIAGTAEPREYRAFLVGSYHYVVWSGSLLSATAEGMHQHGRYPSLVELLRVKSAEEAPHDRWLLADLEQVGGNVMRTRASTGNLAVAAYVAWSRALAEAGSPAYLGAAYLLEGISASRAARAARSLRARGAIAGIEHAVTFLEGHGDADISHIEVMERALSVIDDPADQAAVLTSGDVLAALYPHFFRTAAE